MTADEQYLACRVGSGCGALTVARLVSERDSAAAERDALLPTVVAGGVLAGIGVVGVVVGAILWADADPVDALDRPPTFRVGFRPDGAVMHVTF